MGARGIFFTARTEKVWDFAGFLTAGAFFALFCFRETIIIAPTELFLFEVVV